MGDTRAAGPLRIAATQFPVSGDLAGNARSIRRLMVRAGRAGAHVVHFPETALPGYAPKHLPELDSYPWGALERETSRVRELAASLGLWVVLGSMRPTNVLPRNCTLVIDPTGAEVGVYDKRRLYRAEARAYESGDGPCVVEIGGHRCGFLICYENCFPELYEEYRSLGVGLVFHSFHNAANAGPTSIQDLMAASLIVRAADHGLVISASNSCAPHSPLAASIARPDGSVVRARRNVAGLVLDDYPPAELGWTVDSGDRADAAADSVQNRATTCRFGQHPC